jgi:hypothetical protein
MKILSKIKLSQLIFGFIIASARFLWTEDKHIVTTYYKYSSKKFQKVLTVIRLSRYPTFTMLILGGVRNICLKLLKRLIPI